MAEYFLRRILIMVPTLLGVAVLVFVMPELMEMLGGWLGGGR